MTESANATRQCSGGGFIVGPSFSIPGDASYFQTAGAQYPVGCSQLRCKLCGKAVRQQPGFRDGANAAENAAAIFAEADWSQAPFVQADANARLYCCGCSVVVVSGLKATPMPNAVWTCAGHPPTATLQVLPNMAKSAAQDFAVTLANGHLQQTTKLVAITFTDGAGTRAFPANISLGGDWPTLKIWTPEHQQEPMTLDFACVAGACVQMKDETLKTF